MNEVIRGAWAFAKSNQDFSLIETVSGYRGAAALDPKGIQRFLAPDASDEELGLAVIDALAHSRWVLPAPRSGSSYPPEVEFDLELYDYKKVAERYAAWTKDLMARYGYKTKRALFKNMKSCAIERKGGTITIRPSHHEKLEAWDREKDDGIEDVANSG